MGMAGADLGVADGVLLVELRVIGQRGGIGVQEIPRRALLPVSRGGPASVSPLFGSPVNPLPVLRVA